MCKSPQLPLLFSPSFLLLLLTPPPLLPSSPSPLRPWDKDRYFAPDIEASTRLLREGKVNHFYIHDAVHGPLPWVPITLVSHGVHSAWKHVFYLCLSDRYGKQWNPMLITTLQGLYKYPPSCRRHHHSFRDHQETKKGMLTIIFPFNTRSPPCETLDY